MDGMATGLSNCITKDGQQILTANIPFAGYKVTGAANGSAPQDYTTYLQVFTSPTFTGIPAAPTAAASTNTTQIATTAFVATSFAPLASPALTGVPTVPTAAVGTNTTQAASTAFATALSYAAALPAQSLGFLKSTGTVASFGVDFTGFAANEVKGADIASAATINLTTATGNFVHVTGTVTITAITIPVGAQRTVVFDGVLTLTHGAALLLPSAANITTAANDRMIVRGDTAGAIVVDYIKASGLAVISTSAATQAQMEAATSNVVMATPLNVNWHPGVAKAWVMCGITGNILASYGVSSITDIGVGEIAVVLTTAFSSVNYVPTGNVKGSVNYQVTFNTLAVGSFQAYCTNDAGGAADPVNWFINCHGDQ